MTMQTRVLLVEDEAFIAMELEMELEKAGYRVLEKMARAEDAVVYARKDPPDIILMDIRLAGRMDGIEAVRRIKQRSPVPVIFMTGYQDEEMMKPVRDLEPSAVFVKPINFQLLKLAIDSAVS